MYKILNSYKSRDSVAVKGKDIRPLDQVKIWEVPTFYYRTILTFEKIFTILFFSIVFTSSWKQGECMPGLQGWAYAPTGADPKDHTNGRLENKNKRILAI